MPAILGGTLASRFVPQDMAPLVSLEPGIHYEWMATQRVHPKLYIFTLRASSIDDPGPQKICSV